MAVFKCKMCGGTIEFAPGESVGICDSCGTKQTLPRLDSDKKAQLYDRADHFRRNNEFDKAMGIYEQILNEDEDDAEAYWSLVLCKYGIEYVEDPATHRRIPTVNRAQYTSIFDDEDYKAALRHADGHQREIYEQEAGSINEIQKGILAISAKEEPFDVFICYKETDANGRRTPDSVLANDLYHQLTQEGFKVFFARITLEDKLGSAYEPYIFAALNSAKVMVVLGTRPAYFQAAWVKNEWSRYLALVKESGGKKILIPAYKDMDPYDLPDEFSHLQAQDMSKLGFMQDLIRGIRKIIGAEGSAKPVVTSAAPSVNIGNLLSLARTALEMGDLSEALERANAALSSDVACSEAWEIKMQIIAEQIKKELYDKDHMKEMTACGKKALENADGDHKEQISARVSAVYEDTLRGYMDSFAEVLQETTPVFRIWQNNTPDRVGVEYLQKTQKVYRLFSEVCDGLYDTENTLTLIERIYRALAIRVAVLRLFPELADETGVRNTTMSSMVLSATESIKCFDRATETLRRTFPQRDWAREKVELPDVINEPRTSSGNMIAGGFLTLIPTVILTVVGREYLADSPISILLLLILYGAAIALFIAGYNARVKYGQAMKKYIEGKNAAKEFERKLKML